jgi:hypothetical protein
LLWLLVSAVVVVGLAGDLPGRRGVSGVVREVLWMSVGVAG